MEYIFHICRSVQLLQPTPVRVPEGRRQAWQPAVPFIFLLSVQLTPAWLQVKNWAQNFSLKIIRLKSGVFCMSWHHVRSSRRFNTCELAELTRVNSNTSDFFLYRIKSGESRLKFWALKSQTWTRMWDGLAFLYAGISSLSPSHTSPPADVVCPLHLNHDQDFLPTSSALPKIMT